jgi:hypothetical protein
LPGLLVAYGVVNELLGRPVFEEQTTPGRLSGGGFIVTGAAMIQL